LDDDLCSLDSYYQIESGIKHNIGSMENWNEKKVKLKHQFKNVLETDLTFACGHKEDMIEKLQIKLGKTKEEVLKILNAL
jgi:hypothetical protein